MTAAPSIPASLRLLEVCQLRNEEMTQDNYAADMQRALQCELASPDDAEGFFQSTFPTSGMREICRRVFRRLRQGDASNEPSVYRLGSGFGGGKTHTLIALAGAAKHPQLIQRGITPIPGECAPIQPVRLVTFTGENANLVEGARLDETGAFRAKSLIGHIAWQLGGEYAFQQFRRYDESLSSPGAEDIAQLFGGQPCLILIDELVQWLARFDTPDARERLPSVRPLMSALAKAVETSSHTAMVITAPDAASDAYGEQTQLVLEMLDQLDSILARTSYQASPSSPPELPHILRQRLFAQIDETARSQVSAAYAELCQRSSALITPPPQDRTAWQWFEDHYPFHPDTLRVIADRIAGNDNFQKTRGILRLLGRTLHHMQQADLDDRSWLIHLHHIDPDAPGIHSEITTRINKEEYLPAIKADITDSDATANRIDQTRPTQPARRLARATLLASLAPVGSAQGLTPQELIRATLTPYDGDPSVVANALVEFRNQALYVNDDPQARTVRFTTVANIRRMLLERTHALTAAEINGRIRQAIHDAFTMPRQQSKNHLQATVFPSGSDIPDNPDAVSLGVINYEWLTQGHAGLKPALIQFYRNSPLDGGQRPREYKNNLCLLVADRDSDDAMPRHARRSLAARYIKDNPPDNLQPHQKDILEAELASADKDLFVAIQQRYVHLYYPSTEHPIDSDALLQHVAISQEVAAEKPGEGQHAVIHTLVSRRKLLTPENADLDPDSFWSPRLQRQGGDVSLSNVLDKFAREPGNYMLLNRATAETLIRRALKREALVVQTGAGQTITDENGAFRLDDPEAALHLRNDFCLDCHHAKNECLCHAPKAHLYPQGGQPAHPGACAVDPESEDPGADALPRFDSGLDPQPLNVLVKQLGEHIEHHQGATADIKDIVLRGQGSEFINYLASLLGQQPNAQVSYRLVRGNDINISIAAMGISEWSAKLTRIAPYLEGITGVRTMEADVTLSGASEGSDRLQEILEQLKRDAAAGRHIVGMEARFRSKVGQ